MLEVTLNLETCTMKDLRRFVELTQHASDEYEPYSPDYSIDHPARLTSAL